MAQQTTEMAVAVAYPGLLKEAVGQLLACKVLAGLSL